MYTYPIDYELYSKEEIIELIDFLQAVETANESTIDSKVLMSKYKRYQTIIRSKSMEKQIDKAFEKASGYSVYQTIKKYK